ncbi:hypothetical protein Tco_0381237 [Tanacetum coccineum]
MESLLVKIDMYRPYLRSLIYGQSNTTTPIESNKPLVKDEDGEDVDVHVYRSMIGSLMYLTTSRPNIMFVVYTCARFQVTPKASHLNAVKRIFSDYGGASLDRKSTTSGCQFLGRRLISWQCKKQTIVANSTTKAEYVAAANCCGQLAEAWNISEASIRTDLLFDDGDGIDSLHNQAIFDAIQLMGFSGNVTPLFPSMLAQPTEDEGAVSKRPSETQPTPSPPHPSADQHETQPDPSLRPSPTIPIPDSIPEVTTQAAQIKDLKSQIKQLKKKAKPVISHHNA